MKKKKIILSTCLGALLVIACVGIWLGIRNVDKEVGNGNKLGVSWYHENGDEFVITTAEQLLEMAKLSKYYDFKGQTIKLGADIVINEGSAEDWEKITPEIHWSPIYGFAGTFDGQGHTISGLYSMACELAVLQSVYENAPKVETASKYTGYSYLPIGLFAYTQEDCVIKNLNLTNSIFFNDVYTGCGSVVANGAGTLDTVYSDATIINYRRCAGGLVGLVERGAFTLRNCWYDGEIRNIGNDGRWSGGLIGRIVSTSGETSIEHCLNTADISSEIVREDAQAGGFVGVVSAGSKLNMEDCLTVGTMTAERDGGLGTAVGAAVEGSALMMKNVYTNLDGYPATIGTIGGTYKGFPLELKESCFIGENALAWTNLDFEKYWTVVDGGTPMLREYAETIIDKTSAPKAYDISWYDASKSEYTISTIDEFYGWYILSANNTFAGKTIKLGADLVVNEGDARKWDQEAPSTVWYPIKHFAGTFDGQGHTISGVYLNTNQSGSGLFTTTASTAELKNFKLTNSYLTNRAYNYSYFGGIVGCAEGMLDTIYSDAIVSSTAGRSCGGLAGFVIGKESVYLNNCWFDGSVTILGQKGSQAGGLVGRVDHSATLKISHCLNSGSIASERESTILLLGGFIGVVTNATVEIRDSLNVGKITGLIDNGVASAVSWIEEKAKLSFYNTYTTAESCYKIVDNVVGSYTGGCMPINEKYLVGSKGYQWTLLDFKEFWTIQKNGTPILQSFAESVPNVDGLKKKMDVSWYKTKDKEYTLKTVAEFYGFLYQSYNTDFAKKTVKLGKNIELNTGNAADWATNEPANPWFMVNNFAGTFDGQGRTIKGVYMKNGIQRAGLFSGTTETAILKNFRLENSYFRHEGTTNGPLGSIVGDFAGEMSKIYSNAIVEGDRLLYGGLAGRVREQEAKISNCWFDGLVNLDEKGGWAGGIIGLIQRSKGVTIEHCLSTGTVACKNTAAPSIGGICGNISGDKTTVTITDTLSSGTIDCKAASETGSFIGHVADKTILTIKDTYATSETFKSVMGGKKGDITGTCYKLESNVISGLNGYRFTTLNFKNYWSAIENSTPVLKAFAGAGLNVTNVAKMVDTSWYKAGKKVYELKDVQDLYGFAILSQTTDFKDKTVKLSNSIVINDGVAAGYAINAPENVWVPISKFAGTFDGQGNSIQGLYLKTGQQQGGLFSATTVDATIKNLRLENSYFEQNGTGNGFMGSVVAQGAGTIDTVYSDAIIKGDKLVYGGIVGYVQKDATIRNCWYSGEITLGEKGGWVGGIAGRITGGCKATLEHCLVTGTISSENKDVPSVGGVCGIIDTKDTNVTIIDTLSAGAVITPTTAGVGSLLGYLNAGSSLTIRDTYVTLESHVNYLGGQKGTLVGAALKRATDVLTGNNGYRMTTLDFDNYWVAKENSTPILKTFTNTSMNLSGLARLIDISWYDEKKTVYELADKEDLYGFAVLSATMDFKGKTIKLKNDIIVNEGNAEDWSNLAPANPWAPISKFAGTFDGQGNSIKGIYLKAVTNGYGLFSKTTADAVLKNFRLENSYFEYAGSGNAFLGSIVGELGGTLDGVYSNAIIKGDKLVYGGLAGTVAQKTTIKNCWYDGRMILGVKGGWAGGIVGSIKAKSKVVIDNCLSTATISSEYKSTPSIGGICGLITGTKNDVQLSDSLSAGTIQCGATSGVGSLVGYVEKDNTLKIDNVYATTQCHSVIIGGEKGTVEGICRQIEYGNLEGIKGYQFTFLDFNKDWSAVEGNVPVPKKLAQNELPINTDKMITLGWYDEEAYKEKGYYELNTASDLYGFAYLSCEDDFAGKTIKLGRDITVNNGEAQATGWIPAEANGTDYQWTPIGTQKAFAGTFDGQGHTISGIYAKSTTTQTGLFSVATGATIKDFRLENSYIVSSSGRTGSIAGRFSGRLEKVYSNAIIKNNGDSTNRYGGLVGFVDGATTISECWFAGSVSGNSVIGGLVGYVDDGDNTKDVVIEHCLNSGIVQVTSGSGSGGGLIGAISKAKTITIFDTLNAKSVTIVEGKTSNYLGSVAGTSNKTINFTNSYFAGPQSGCPSFASGASLNAVNSGKITVENNLGNNGYKMKNLDFANYWVAKHNSTPELRSFSDTFLNDVTYDKNENPIYTIDSPEDLYEFAIRSQYEDFANSTVRLGADVVANEGTATENGWTENDNPTVWLPIGSDSKPFAGTFDGQGYTISGIYANSTTTQTGLFSVATGATIKDFRLENSYIESSSGRTGSIAGRFSGRLDTVYSNAIIKNTSTSLSRYGGLIGYVDGAATISNCWFAGSISGNSVIGGLVGYVDDGDNTKDVVIEHCLNSGTVQVTGKAGSGGGIVGAISKAKTITIFDTLNAKSVTIVEGKTSNYLGSVAGTSNKTIDFTNSYFAGPQSGCPSFASGASLNAVNSGKITVENNLGNNGYKMKNLDFANYWVAKHNSTPELKSFSDTFLNDVAYDKNQNPIYTIDSPEDFYEFAIRSQYEDFANSTVRLGTDIVANEGTATENGWTGNDNPTVWLPIGSDDKPFAGTFDGKGKTISGIYANSATTQTGLFSVATGATIKDFRLENSYIESSSGRTGSIAGRFSGRLDTVYSNAIIKNTSTSLSRYGGLIGYVDGATTISNCWFAGSVSGNSNVGGIVGYVDDGDNTKDVVIEHCLNSGTVQVIGASGSGGGIVGVVKSAKTFTIFDTLNVKSVTIVDGKTSNYLGSAVGQSYKDIYFTNSFTAKPQLVCASLTNGAKVKDKDSMLITVGNYFGNNAYKMTKLDFADYWVAKQNSTPELQSFTDATTNYVP